ncbi:hypothetical protein EMIHUDRAFT_437568 [Emiliania huxleyi CCMP1516]|uniref:Srp40 C-terminal domain-containing protein n=2 Tax=Emiliania huxleyi TaxID=2903 RepID=A0A0D3IK00_EMIH1|nr:hypothetical protein EMIHUDRAFT_437568 [Emiliania huxleyi CCMP1516]EOD11585.1 hypothetical protein EMIHUDRAFT_437568 [Emiliania huxleyi CCMP1516]|eukprot:XP_005764014.1 hypothetical protein EMIHUDRAFT_437568 [Emiliania huxleyi CCMP1516]
MDSLLYLQGNDDDDDDDEEEGEEEIEAGVDAAAAAGSGGAGSSALDFEAVKRAGYTGSNTALSDTATSKRLDEEAKERRAAKEAAAAADAEAEEARAAALAQEERTLLDRKLIDEKYPKQNRFSKTGEDFRKKEARKRKMGQQNSGGDWVQEEKRRIRHAGMNCDS